MAGYGCVPDPTPCELVPFGNQDESIAILGHIDGVGPRGHCTAIVRPVEFERYLGKKYPDGRFNVWVKTAGRLPDDQAIHQCVLAYASDMGLLDTALVPHGRTLFEKEFMAASLDHALWLHRPFSRRRVAALRAGFAQSARLARLLARTYIHAGRHAGRLGGARRAAAAAGSHRISIMKRSLLVCVF